MTFNYICECDTDRQRQPFAAETLD